MDLILNENEWVEKCFEESEFLDKPFNTLKRVARYFIDKGYTKSQVRKEMDNFLLKCDPTASIVLWDGLIESAYKTAKNGNAVNIGKIAISIDEMEIIKSIPKKQTQRLAFTLLCLSKYWNILTNKTSYWVNTPYKDIMKMANINTGLKRQCQMYGELREYGLVKFSRKVNNASTQVLFATDGETALEVSNFHNLGYQYQKYLGEPFFVCQSCGHTEKIKHNGAGRPQKYCDSCAVKIRMKQNIESVMKMRK